MKKIYTRNPNFNCSICCKHFYKRPREIEKMGGKGYCSLICYGISQRKPVPCLFCGKEILGGKNAKTCSRECSNKNRTGITYKQFGRACKDNVVSNRAIKTRLIEKYGDPMCNSCGYNKIPDVVQVHHIIERSKGGSNEITNLMFLCPTCHSEEHYYRRNKSNK